MSMLAVAAIVAMTIMAIEGCGEEERIGRWWWCCGGGTATRFLDLLYTCTAEPLEHQCRGQR